MSWPLPRPKNVLQGNRTSPRLAPPRMTYSNGWAARRSRMSTGSNGLFESELRSRAVSHEFRAPV